MTQKSRLQAAQSALEAIAESSKEESIVKLAELGLRLSGETDAQRLRRLADAERKREKRTASGFQPPSAGPPPDTPSGRRIVSAQSPQDGARIPADGVRIPHVAEGDLGGGLDLPLGSPDLKQSSPLAPLKTATEPRPRDPDERPSDRDREAQDLFDRRRSEQRAALEVFDPGTRPERGPS